VKKTFFQTNLLFQVFVSIFLVGFVVFQILAFKIGYLIISSAISGSTNYLIDRIVIFLLFELMACLLLIIFFRFEHNNIHINNGKIYMNDDWLRQKEKIQFYSEVHISDIYRIDIIWTSKNSKQKNINGRAFSSSMPKAYISFEKNNGEIVNMLILYMNKKTISKMIDCIKQEMIKINNLNLIEETANLVDRFIKPQKLKNK